VSEPKPNYEATDNERLCPLTLAPVGQDLRLCRLCKGRRMARRLAELGLTPGVCLRIVQDAGGPLLISVRNSRVALGRGIADKLTVQVLNSAETSQAVQPNPQVDA
jgi:ferrous iron transport protein A